MINKTFIILLGIFFQSTLLLTEEQKLDFTREDLLLPISPYGPCVIHLTIFEDFYETLDMAESFLKVNYLAHVWTVWKQTDRKISIPVRSIRYYEICAFTVFADTPFPQSQSIDWDYVKLIRIKYSHYSLLSRGQYSMYIILRLKCEHPKFVEHMKYSTTLVVTYLILFKLLYLYNTLWHGIAYFCIRSKTATVC